MAPIVPSTAATASAVRSSSGGRVSAYRLMYSTISSFSLQYPLFLTGSDTPGVFA